ncbi:hypothetical protein [Dyella agri]|uniref:Uncharacterized protein n=1 Tax=Dyella agri TaxID=1926869 RepID=A0ABW8KJX6_9GAMM
MKRWQRIAAGSLEDPEGFEFDVLHAWIREIAAKVVAADSRPAADRSGALVSAVGLSGKAAALEPLREQMEVIDEFSFLDEHGRERPPRRGERMEGLMKVAKASGLVDDDPTDEQLRHRIKRLLGRDL